MTKKEMTGGGAHGEVVPVELPAPPSWKKLVYPKEGGKSRRNEILFISPTGEEIRTRNQLKVYLKSHPEITVGASEFDWGSGETPKRRSARISDLANTTPTTQESVIPRKGGRSKVSITYSDETEKESEGKKDVDNAKSETSKKRGRRSSTGKKKDDDDVESEPPKKRGKRSSAGKNKGKMYDNDAEVKDEKEADVSDGKKEVEMCDDAVVKEKEDEKETDVFEGKNRVEVKVNEDETEGGEKGVEMHDNDDAEMKEADEIDDKKDVEMHDDDADMEVKKDVDETEGKKVVEKEGKEDECMKESEVENVENVQIKENSIEDDVKVGSIEASEDAKEEVEGDAEVKVTGETELANQQKDEIKENIIEEEGFDIEDSAAKEQVEVEKNETEKDVLEGFKFIEEAAKEEMEAKELNLGEGSSKETELTSEWVMVEEEEAATATVAVDEHNGWFGKIISDGPTPPTINVQDQKGPQQQSDVFGAYDNQNVTEEAKTEGESNVINGVTASSDGKSN